MRETKRSGSSIARRVRSLCADSILEYRNEYEDAWLRAFFAAATAIERDHELNQLVRIAEKLQNNLEQLPLNLEGTGGLTATEYVNEVCRLVDDAVAERKRMYT